MAKRMNYQQVMQRLGGDEFLQDLLGQVEVIGRATDKTGRSGKVTLTVKTSKSKGAEPGDLYITYETECVISKLPQRKPRVTGLYVSEIGITSDDPRQEEMDFRVVPQGDPEDREVAVGQPQARRV